MNVVGGDPASCSALAGRLRRQAATLRDRRQSLWQSAAGVQNWSHPSARAINARIGEQLVAVDRLVGQLDELGAALQAYSVELAAAQHQEATAHQYAVRHGLRVGSDGTVRPATGPVPVEVAWSRRAALPIAQEQIEVARGCGSAATERLTRRTAVVLPLLRASTAGLEHEAAR